MKIRNIGELAVVVAGDGSPNYKSGPMLIELFNEFGFNDEYITPSVGISTDDLGQGLSRNPYTKKRLSIISERGQLGEFLDMYLSSVEDFDYAKSKIDAIIAKNNTIGRYSAIVQGKPQMPDKLDLQVGLLKEKTRLCLFISYSWDSREHKCWVRQLADDLKEKGYEVLLDQYLPLGTPLSPFMMDGIKKSDKVLIIGTTLYKQKAESHLGGTAVEDQIVNIHIGREFDSTKFVPILREGTFNDSFTELVSDRKGIDFRNDLLYKESIEELVAGLTESLELYR